MDLNDISFFIVALKQVHDFICIRGCFSNQQHTVSYFLGYNSTTISRYKKMHYGFMILLNFYKYNYIAMDRLLTIAI